MNSSMCKKEPLLVLEFQRGKWQYGQLISILKVQEPAGRPYLDLGSIQERIFDFYLVVQSLLAIYQSSTTKMKFL